MNDTKNICYYISYKNIYNFAKRLSTYYDKDSNENNEKGLILGEMISKWNGLSIDNIKLMIYTKLFLIN
mgnify:CR=1 FL=1